MRKFIQRFCAVWGLWIVGYLAITHPFVWIEPQYVATVPATKTAASGLIAYVSSNSNSWNCFSSPCAVSYSPVAGNRLIVDVASEGTTGCSVSDNGASGGSTYTANGAGATYSASVIAKEFQAPVVAASVTTLTITCTGSATGIVGIASQYSGGTGVADQTFTTLNTGASQTTQNGVLITPAAGFNEIVHIFVVQNTNDTTVFANSGSYTNRASQAEVFSNYMIGVGDQLVASTTGSYTGSQTTATAVNYGATTTSYK